MNFIVSSAALLKQLQLVAGVVPSRSVLPIIENFLFEIKKDKLEITATDLEISMRTSLAIETRGSEIKLAVPARIILEILKNLPEQPVTFTVNEDNFGVEISSENGKYKLTGENGDDFPQVPEATQTGSVRMPTEVLLKAIQKTLFAASTDELKPAMNGMLFNFTDSGVTFVATDAHRLVRYRRVDITVKDKISIIVPQKALNLMKNSLVSSDEVLTIEYNENNAFFSLGNTLLVCRLIADRYPDYENVIPTNNPNKLIINKRELIGTLKRVNIFANRTTHQIRFKIAGSELTISSEDVDFANEAKETLKCIYDGEDMEIGFNATFLLDVVANIDTQDVVVELSTPNRAGIVVPDEQEEGVNLLMLVMPVMLNTFTA
ncbi:MAG: DNA polymerase III subunit beta [Sphingobacteriia bacterium]|jgi:DNA polymerase-3 subunit beta|nr:DNA polymerase III subunit beta [Sphingobacteriia bacterium]